MKKIILIALMLILITVLAGCTVGNRQVGIDTTHSFDRFILTLGGKTIEGSVQAWRDFDDGDEIQIVSTTGETYLTHYANVIMIKSK